MSDRYRQIGDAVAVALDRMDAAMTGGVLERTTAEHARLVLAGLDIVPRDFEAFRTSVAHGIADDLADLGLSDEDARITVAAIAGAYTLGYIVGRLHDPEGGA